MTGKGQAKFEQGSYIGGLDCKVHRNYYGRQNQSFIAPVMLSLDKVGDVNTTVDGVFIRAPAIENVGHGVQVIGTIDHGPSHTRQIVAVKQRNIIGTTFHPELTDSTLFHRMLMEMIAKQL